MFCFNTVVFTPAIWFSISCRIELIIGGKAEILKS
jgi:hypothetical protein